MKESVLSVGWARRDITPPLPVCLCGQFHIRIAEKVLDPLTLTAWAVSNEEDSLLWISCDLLGIPDDFHGRCREILSAKLPGFDPAKLVLSATHTHTAPYLTPMWHNEAFPAGTYPVKDYFELVLNAAVDAAIEAWNSRRAGRISYGHGYAVCAWQRRMTYFHNLDLPHVTGEKIETNAAMYGATNTPEFKGFEGNTDHRIDFIFTYDQDGKPTGAVAALPCPAQATEWLSEISADFWHEVRIELAKRYGENFQLLPLCCAAGDLTPRQQLQKSGEERMFRLSGKDNRQLIASRIVAALEEAVQWSSKEMISSVKLCHLNGDIDVSRRRISDDEYQLIKSGLAQLKQSSGSDLRTESVRRAKLFRAEQIIERYNAAQETCSIEHHVIRLGDVAFCTCPQELFLNYALRIQAQSPAVATMVIQLAGRGVRPNGYLPTVEAESGGGYSACIYCCAISPEGGQQMVDSAVAKLKSIFI
ncbi:MAG: hypothetical protein E7054_07885 [Lentisphaerae bacterium]|nr:hypothetical protein [Lentisphaerota bacterium]